MSGWQALDVASAGLELLGVDAAGRARLLRGRDGRMLVLEDNTRTPSGIAYAMAATDVRTLMSESTRSASAWGSAGAAAIAGTAIRACSD